MPAKPAEKKIKRRVALVEFEDGRVVEYNLGKPIYEYEITQAGVDPENTSEVVFWTLYLAAGRPGANGGDLNLEADRPLLKEWLASLAAYEFPDSQPVPPTMPPVVSPT